MKIFSCSLFFSIVLLANASGEERLSFVTVDGADGVPLSVVEWGNKEGPDVLFVHGYAQSYLSWKRQLDSDLGDDFHLVAFDLRGHGNSGKPWAQDQYSDTRMWADDVAAVIEATELDRPVVVAWSYGGVVMSDYIRHHGAGDVAALNLVGTDGRLIERPPIDPAIRKEIEETSVLALSPNYEESLVADRARVALLTAMPFDDEWAETVLAYNAATPAYVFQAMVHRPIDNSDIVENFTLPVLISWGSLDRAMTDEQARLLAAQLPNATLSRYDEIGHSPFYEDAARFNGELRALVSEHRKE